MPVDIEALKKDYGKVDIERLRRDYGVIEEKPKRDFLRPTPTEALTTRARPVKYPEPTPWTAALAGLGRGVTAGYLDISPEARKKYPIPAGVGEFAGFVAPLGVAAKPFQLIKAAQKLPWLARTLARGVTTGGIYGAVKKPEEEETRLRSALEHAAIFGGLDVATAGLGRLARPLIKKVLPKKPPVAKEPIISPKPESAIIESDLSAQRVIGALKEVKPLRKLQEKLYTAERARKIAKVEAVGKEIRGEPGFYAKLAQLKGELPKVARKAQFESIRKKVSQADIDNLFNAINDSRMLTGFEKITAGRGLLKLFGEYAGKIPTEGELILLEQVFPSEFISAIMKKRPLWTQFKEAGLQLANMPRSFMAGFMDLSFGGRQGAFAAPRFRKQFWSSWKEQFKIFGSEKAYQSSRQALTEHPNFIFAKESKISFTELGKIMGRREERFMSQWAEKIPLLGKGVRMTGRAYTAFANKFRLDIFSKMVKDAEAMGFKPRKDPLLARRIADFVNNATGRGSLGSFERAATTLNAFFFSPRLNIARVKLLNPFYYTKQPKFVRAEALKTALAAAGTATTILTLADLAGLEVGWDPRNADFGKIKIKGKTRIDMLAGFGQFMRGGAQLIMGQYISSVTGKRVVLGEGFKPLTRLDIFERQIASKEAPVFSFATDLMRGRNWAGEPVYIPREVANRFVPMVMADVVDLAKEDPKLIPFGALAFFGIGLLTYESYPPEVREFNRFLSEVESKKRELKELEDKPEKQWEFKQANKEVFGLLAQKRFTVIISRLRKLNTQMWKMSESDLSYREKRLKTVELKKQMTLWAKEGLKYIE